MHFHVSVLTHHSHSLQVSEGLVRHACSDGPQLPFFGDNAIQRTFYNDGNICLSNTLDTNTMNALNVTSVTEEIKFKFNFD